MEERRTFVGINTNDDDVIEIMKQEVLIFSVKRQQWQLICSKARARFMNLMLLIQIHTHIVRNHNKWS